MLKKCYGLFLGLVVLAGSACVTPTHASSASIVITNIRAGSQTSALEEGVVVYNNSSFEVDVTNWCLTNKAQVKFACLESVENEHLFLPAYGRAVIVSVNVSTSSVPNAYSAVYEHLNNSSGSIVASSDTISLIDSSGLVVDQYSWSSSLSSTRQWERMKLSALPDIFIDTNSANDWQKKVYTEFPLSDVVLRYIGHEEPEEPVEEPIDPTILPKSLKLTELLPNAVGADTGNEFIEIFNPNEIGEISLSGYKLAVGPLLEKLIALPDYKIQAGEYKSFTNAELNYSLLNSSSRVALLDLGGQIISEAPAYSSPAEGEAWAFIEGVWQYTNQPTPGVSNLLYLVGDEEPEIEGTVASTLKPCAANQYRSLETNRCRLISSTATSASVACKAGQERNPETNRCRNISTSSSSTCKEGQEKNPETNRCRNIKKLSTADYGVKGATTQQQGGLGWYMWAAIGGIILLVVGYAVWEWRDELGKLVKFFRAKFAGKMN